MVLPSVSSAPIITCPGFIGPDFLQTCIPDGGGTTAVAANLIYLRRFRLAKPMTITKGTIFVATAAGNVDICWYSYDGTNLTLLGNSGAVLVAGTNANQEVALTASLSLPANVDLFGGAAWSSTATVFRQSFSSSGTSAIAAKGNQHMTKASVVPGSLPSSVAFSGFSGTSLQPWVFFE